MPWDVQDKLSRREKQKAQESGEFISNTAETARKHAIEDEKILKMKRESDQRQKDIVSLVFLVD